MNPDNLQLLLSSEYIPVAEPKVQELTFKDAFGNSFAPDFFDDGSWYVTTKPKEIIRNRYPA